MFDLLALVRADLLLLNMQGSIHVRSKKQRLGDSCEDGAFPNPKDMKLEVDSNTIVASSAKMHVQDGPVPDGPGADGEATASAKLHVPWSERRADISRRMHDHHTRWMAAYDEQAQAAYIANTKTRQDRRQSPANAAA